MCRDFPDDADVHRITTALWEKGAVVGAVCHGPSALVNVKLSDGEYLVKGKKVAAFSNEEEDAVSRREVTHSVTPSACFVSAAYTLVVGALCTAFTSYFDLFVKFFSQSSHVEEKNTHHFSNYNTIRMAVWTTTTTYV